MSVISEAAVLWRVLLATPSQTLHKARRLQSMERPHGHGPWAWTCSMPMHHMSKGINIQHRNGHAARTWTCSTYMNMQHGHGHAAWTQTCRIVMNMQHERGHKHGEMAWTCCWFGIVALFKAVHSIFSLILQFSPSCAVHWWWSSWPSPPRLSQARTNNCCFYFEDNTIRKAV